MTKWIIIISGIITALILGYVFWELQKMEEDPSALPAPESNAITLTHSFQDGVHRYVGTLRFPHSCFSIASDVIRDPKDQKKLLISLTTTDNLTERGLCVKLSTPISFEVIADAPEGVTASLRVNGVATPVKVNETAWQNPRGTILNLENPL